MSPAKRKAQATQPETEAGGAGTVPPREPDAPPGTGNGEPPRPEPPPSGSEGPGAEPPEQPEREPFNVGDVVAVGATVALGLLLLVVLRGRRSLT